MKGWTALSMIILNFEKWFKLKKIIQLSKKSSIKNYIKTYFKDFGPETVKKLTPSGSNPGKTYSLVKVRKDYNPVRPAVSMIGTPEYRLTKFLDAIIKPCIPQTEMLKIKKKQFLDRINNSQFEINQKLVRFDFSSLFTNTPLEQTM